MHATKMLSSSVIYIWCNVVQSKLTNNIHKKMAATAPFLFAKDFNYDADANSRKDINRKMRKQIYMFSILYHAQNILGGY